LLPCEHNICLKYLDENYAKGKIKCY